ncbi:MAG: hypothetical protein MRY79_02410, partial [Alphaproteobacteria bacterium]|nr:hypothetical protein [Alphaproteobacteria bacterium]
MDKAVRNLLAGTAMLAMGAAASSDASQACGGNRGMSHDDQVIAQVDQMKGTSVAKALQGQGTIEARAGARCIGAPLVARFSMSSEATPEGVCEALKGVEARTP